MNENCVTFSRRAPVSDQASCLASPLEAEGCPDFVLAGFGRLLLLPLVFFFAVFGVASALVYPPALTADGLALIDAVFERVIEVGEADARERFACNATACLGRTVIIERGCTALRERLASLYYDVVEVETGEFLKSGGSVYCMKQWLF